MSSDQCPPPDDESGPRHPTGRMLGGGTLAANELAEPGRVVAPPTAGRILAPPTALMTQLDTSPVGEPQSRIVAAAAPMIDEFTMAAAREVLVAADNLLTLAHETSSTQLGTVHGWRLEANYRLEKKGGHKWKQGLITAAEVEVRPHVGLHFTRPGCKTKDSQAGKGGLLLLLRKACGDTSLCHPAFQIRGEKRASSKAVSSSRQAADASSEESSEEEDESSDEDLPPRPTRDAAVRAVSAMHAKGMGLQDLEEEMEVEEEEEEGGEARGTPQRKKKRAADEDEEGEEPVVSRTPNGKRCARSRARLVDDSSSSSSEEEEEEEEEEEVPQQRRPRPKKRKAAAAKRRAVAAVTAPLPAARLNWQSEPDELKRAVMRCFGYQDVYDWQRQVVTALLEGRDVIGAQPTGGGKSLCYQLPAIIDALRTTEARAAGDFDRQYKTAVIISPAVSVRRSRSRDTYGSLASPLASLVARSPTARPIVRSAANGRPNLGDQRCPRRLHGRRLDLWYGAWHRRGHAAWCGAGGQGDGAAGAGG